MLATGELLVIAIVAIIAVDPKKLPDLMKGLGKALGEFKQMGTDVKRSFEREAEMADFEKRKADAHETLYGSGAKTPEPDAASQPSAAQPGAEQSATAQDAPELSPEEIVAAQEERDRAAAEKASAESRPVAESTSDAENADDAFTRAEQALAQPETVVEPVIPANAEAPETPVESPVEPETKPEDAAVESAGVPAMPTPSDAAAATSETPVPAQAEGVPDVPAEVAAGGPPAEGPPPPPLAGDEAVGEGASGRMSLFDHLGDLRKRLTRSVVSVLVGFLVCYAFAGQMLKILMQPMLTALKQSHFIYTLPTEAFFAEMWIAFLAGLFLVSPYIFYQIWSFIAPGLYKHERRWIIPIALCSALFFVSGSMFGYFVVFPFGFEFFASYASDILFFTPKLDEYLGFALKLLFAFGLVFELPLFLFFLARLGIVSHVGLRAKRKYAILGAFIAAAALTPPDAISQIMMAVPLVLLYEVGIWGAYFFGKKKPKPQEPTGEA